MTEFVTAVPIVHISTCHIFFKNYSTNFSFKANKGVASEVIQVSLPEAQLPLAVPLLLIHSLEVKQVPKMVLAVVELEATQRLKEKKYEFVFTLIAKSSILTKGKYKWTY